jgi:hypothetical protein
MRVTVPVAAVVPAFSANRSGEMDRPRLPARSVRSSRESNW